MAWRNPKIDWTPNDRVNPDDMNRIEGNIAEIETRVEAGKNDLSDAITSMGQPAGPTDSFATLANKIKSISKDANAATGEVLAEKTFYQGGVKRIGTMPNQGSKSFTPNDSTQTGVAGYYSGITVAARPTLSGNSAVGDVLDGKTFYGSNYTKQTGTIPTKAAATYTPGTANQTIAAGQYLSGAQTIQGDANLIPANIVKDKSIFGVNGNFIERCLKPGTETLFVDNSVRAIWVYTPTLASQFTQRIFYMGGKVKVNYSLEGRGETAGVTTAAGNIYINGVPSGTERQTATAVYYEEDIEVEAGDLLAIYGWIVSSNRQDPHCTISNFKISCAPITSTVT